MSDTKVLIAILIMAAVTALLRFLPFIVFRGKKTPAYIEYLGKVLPFSIMGMLVVYCLKDISFGEIVGWIPPFAGVIATVGIQAWKRNSIYSILAGTIVYMVLIRVM